MRFYFFILNYFKIVGALNNEVNFQSLPTLNNHILIFIGHYNVPTFSSQKLLGTSKDVALLKDEATQTSPEECIDNEPTQNFISHENTKYKEIAYDKREALEVTQNWVMEQYKILKIWLNQQENKGLKLSLIIMTGCVIAMFWYLQIQVIKFSIENVFCPYK